ncbi:MAG TPA: GNAT family N-acetyltransferase [Kineosporiaceae bacterium]|nr:GNAT family N-acetyltransferase [Kineosporiaceae bacterium]
MTGAETIITELTTERLLLRGWRDADREPFAAICADAEVMRYFPGILSRAETDASVDRFRARFAERGYGLWAVEVKATGAFAGFVGLNPAPDEVPAAPATEIGWRLGRSFWGRGYAPEAARTVLQHAFGRLGLTELVSFTTVANAQSRRVMEKLGMTHDPADDFDNPGLKSWSDARHVTYRLTADAYRAGLRAPTAAS